MNEPLTSLLDLQKIDADLHFLRDLRSRRPLELEKEREKLARAREAVKGIDEEIKKLKIECDKGELELRQNQGEIEKLQIALNTCKSNQEYQILRDKKERVQEKVGEVEELVLEKLGRIDELREERARGEDRAAEVGREFAAREQEMNAFLREVDEKLAKLDGERETRKATIPPDALELYERVLNRYHDSALAVVETKICQGCYMSVTTQDINQLMMGADLLQCKNCMRILYLPQEVR